MTSPAPSIPWEWWSGHEPTIGTAVRHHGLPGLRAVPVRWSWPREAGYPAGRQSVLRQRRNRRWWVGEPNPEAVRCASPRCSASPPSAGSWVPPPTRGIPCAGLRFRPPAASVAAPASPPGVPGPTRADQLAPVPQVRDVFSDPEGSASGVSKIRDQGPGPGGRADQSSTKPLRRCREKGDHTGDQTVAVIWAMRLLGPCLVGQRGCWR